MNKKKLVQTIKKISQELTDAPGVSSDRPKPSAPKSQPSKPTSYPGAPLSVVNIPAVGEMQKLIQTISENISSYFLKTPSTAQKDMSVSNLGSNLDKQKNTTAFGQFLIQNYQTKAEELTPDNDITDFSQKQSVQAFNILNVLNDLKKIGSRKLEYKIDNRWGDKTNLALKNIKNISQILLKLKNDLKLNVGDFQQKDLNDLVIFESIDEIKKTDAQTIKSYANKNIIILTKILAFFNVIKDAGFAQIEDYIEGRKPLAVLGGTQKSKDRVITEQQHNMLQDLNNMLLIPEYKSKTIPEFNKKYKTNISSSIFSIPVNIDFINNNVKRTKSIAVPLKMILTGPNDYNHVYEWLISVLGEEAKQDTTIMSQLHDELRKFNISSLLGQSK